jgi:hypothetical protein
MFVKITTSALSTELPEPKILSSSVRKLAQVIRFHRRWTARYGVKTVSVTAVFHMEQPNSDNVRVSKIF